MAKVHPQNQTAVPLSSTSCDAAATSCSSSSSSSSKYTSAVRETFTVWMKSLVFHGNGCTIFNSKGELAFRVDNYQQRCCSEVFLMNPNGDILFSVQRKKIRVLERWISGYKWSDSNEMNKEKPWIQTRKCRKFLGGRSKNMGYRVVDTTTGIGYTIIGSDGKSEFKIIDSAGQIVAEARQKRSSNGVSYGEDVLTLMVDPQIDHLLIVALMTVHALIHHTI